MEKVSVILPVFNAEESLSRTIKSVLNQTYKNIELIIIDDCSTDNSVEIINTFIQHDSRIKLFCNLKNMGVSYSRNKGIDEATGKYIAFIDSDDKWYFNKIEVQMNYIINKKVNWVFSNYKYVGRKQEYIVSKPKGKYTYDEILRNGNPIGLLTCLINKKIIENFRFENVHHEDYLLWLKIAKEGHSAYNTGDVLAEYAADIKGISSNKVKSFLWTFNIYLHECDKLTDALKLQINYVKNYFLRKK